MCLALEGHLSNALQLIGFLQFSQLGTIQSPTPGSPLATPSTHLPSLKFRPFQQDKGSHPHREEPRATNSRLSVGSSTGVLPPPLRTTRLAPLDLIGPLGFVGTLLQEQEISKQPNRVLMYNPCKSPRLPYTTVKLQRIGTSAPVPLSLRHQSCTGTCTLSTSSTPSRHRPEK